MSKGFLDISGADKKDINKGKTDRPVRVGQTDVKHNLMSYLYTPENEKFLVTRYLPHDIRKY